MLKFAKNQPKQQVFVINMQKCQKQKLSKTFKNAENYEIELEYDDDLMRKIHPDMPTSYALKVETVENQWCKLIHKYFQKYR